jgi:hypothetical protein
MSRDDDYEQNEQKDYDADFDRGNLNQRLDETIERYAEATKDLCASLDEKIAAIAERHHVLVGLEKLQANFDVPLKTLSKRLGLLQQIDALQEKWSRGNEAAFATMSTDRLVERIKAFETIARLEPDPEKRASIKSLRERARLLTTIEHGEPASPVVDDHAAPQRPLTNKGSQWERTANEPTTPTET